MQAYESHRALLELVNQGSLTQHQTLEQHDLFRQERFGIPVLVYDKVQFEILRNVVTNEATGILNQTNTELTVLVQGNPFRTTLVEPAPIVSTMNNLEMDTVTLLVPTNEAFQALNVNSLDDLLNEQQDGDFLLTRVLETHVYRDLALYRESITSFVAGNQGTPIQLTSESGTDWILSVTQFPQSVQDTAEVAVETVRTEPGLPITRANFIDTQVMAFRGVIHWIDAVLLP